MVKAIFFDIDGTLREFEKKGISMSTRQALDKARPAVYRHRPALSGDRGGKTAG